MRDGCAYSRALVLDDDALLQDGVVSQQFVDDPRGINHLLLQTFLYSSVSNELLRLNCLSTSTNNL